MKKTKKHTYKFNPRTLSYEKVIVDMRDKVRKISFTVLFGLVLGVLFMVIGFQLVDSPKERALKREISQYQQQLKNLNVRVNRAQAVLNDLEERDDNVYRTIFAAEPMRSMRDSAANKEEDYAELQGYDCSSVLEQTTRKVDALTKRLYVQSKSIDDVYQMAQTKQERLSSIPAIMPVDKRKCSIASGFGYRFHPILHTSRMHTGIDLTARKGTPVYATAAGTVVVAGKNLSDFSGYGVVCVVDHGYGYQTLYGHLTDLKVKRGQKVSRGQQVGTVGSTGLAQAPHLHYEVIQNGKKVNPVFFFFNDLSTSEYEDILEQASQENQCLS